MKLPQSIKQLNVHVNGVRSGDLRHGSHFLYLPEFATSRPVSLTMTDYKPDGFTLGTLHPVFAQNLPEGSNRRFIQQKLARYAKVNDMYLLALQGDNGIGMLGYSTKELDLPQVESMPLDDILSYSGSKPIFPELLERYYLRNSLSGMQPKISLINSEVKNQDADDGQDLMLGRTIQQKDFIVKTFDEHDLLTVNEFVCMEAARHCGISTPKTYLSENLENFVVERFDRVGGVRYGLEDFVTLMKLPNSDDAKYIGSYENVLKATKMYTGSQEEVDKVYKYIVFNAMIGNGDAHLKNFALQYSPDMKDVHVSPIFDVTHTKVYPLIPSEMALKMDKSKSWPDRNTLMKLAEGKDYSVKDPREIIDSVAEGIHESVSRSQEATLLKGLKESIDSHVTKVHGSQYSSKSYRHDKKRKFDF